MTWGRFRGHAPSNSRGTSRRQSMVDITRLQSQSDYAMRNDQSASQSNALPRAALPHLVPLSMDQLDASNGSSATRSPPSSMVRDPSPKPQRFSLLKFRHASDSQLSRTAKDQASRVSPPMPTGKLLFVPRIASLTQGSTDTLWPYSSLDHYYSTDHGSI